MKREKPWCLAPIDGEEPEELETRRNRAYFGMTLNRENKEWFRRMPSLNFNDRKILEIGCGHGALSIMMAQQGAARVLGIDLDSRRIAFANANLQTEYPQYAKRVLFRDIDVSRIDDSYDMVVSKDTFEHIEDLSGMLLEIRRLLKPGGLLAAGFSPLYFSPFGDHGRLQLKIPWVHAVLPEALLIRRLERRTGRSLSSISNLGLNRITYPEFRDLMDRYQWTDMTFQVYCGRGWPRRIFQRLRRFESLERYFTVGLYIVARVPSR